eukprot:4938236-Lingulodinium_polyedra.AAC.1
MKRAEEVRGGDLKARLCVRPFGAEPKHPDELYSPTPKAPTAKMRLVRARLKGHAVRIFDVGRAFLHAPIRDDVWVEAPM